MDYRVATRDTASNSVGITQITDDLAQTCSAPKVRQRLAPV